jgi:predicted transport protein
MLVMRLLDCHSQNAAFTASQMVEAIRILEAYVLRRAICREQTRGYWQVFANLAYDIDQANPLDSLKVGLVRLQGTYRAMPAKEFEHALEADDIYNLRVCKFLLDRLENYCSKEPTPLDTLSIEHIMPQTLEQPWVKMLGEKAEAVHAAWLHRLGNLTLTGYNSEYSKHPFEKKKTMAGGFAESAVRLNQYVRDQPVWTETQMAERGQFLAAKAIEIWPALAVSPALLKAAQERDKRQQAADSADAVLKVSPKAAPLFAALKEAMVLLGPVIEIVHGTSVSYHAPDFFLEVLPRRNRLTLILPLEFSELQSPPSFAGDRSEWKFIVNAQHSGGVLLSVTSPEEVQSALPIIQQALYSVRGDGG